MSLEKAISLAAEKHAGQVDKMGRPYIIHPIMVMVGLGPDATEAERIVAILHDIVEDTDVTFDDLRRMGFSEEVVDAIRRLTKEKGYDEEKHLLAILDNVIAKKVKIKDIEHNMDLKRLKNKNDLQESDFKRLKRYLKWYGRLTGT